VTLATTRAARKGLRGKVEVTAKKVGKDVEKEEKEDGAKRDGETMEELKKGDSSTRGHHGPTYIYGLKLANSNALKKIFSRILDAVVPEVTVGDLVGLSGDVQKKLVEQLHTIHIPAGGPERPILKHRAAVVSSFIVPGVKLEYTTLLREISVKVGGVGLVTGTLDDGSKLVVISRRKVDELGLKVNKKRLLSMEAANGSIEVMRGCVEWLEIEVSGIKTWGHVYVVDGTPYDLLLGLPWYKSTRLQKIMIDNGVDIVIHNPKNLQKSVWVKLLARDSRSGGEKRSLMAKRVSFEDNPEMVEFLDVEESDEEEEIDVEFELGEGAEHLSTEEQELVKEDAMRVVEEMQVYIKSGNSELATVLINDIFIWDQDRNVFVYKKVANKIKLVATTTPDKFKIHRH
jgi:hypothetical protein